MSTRKRNLTQGDLRQAFADQGDRHPVIMSPAQLAEVLGMSVKTVYDWMAHGRLDGAYRKRGKHNLIWRDRALEIIFNGPEWNS